MEKEEIKENKSKSNLMLIIVLIGIILGLTGYIVYDKCISKEDNNKIEEKENQSNIQDNNQNTNQEKNSAYEQKIIEKNDYDEIKNFDYNYKTKSITSTPDEIGEYFDTYVDNGYLYYKIFEMNEYKRVDNISGIISVGSAFCVHGPGFIISYVLTDNDELYKITIENNTYSYKIEKQNVNNIQGIYVTYGHKFNSNGVAGIPTVFIKTKDNKYLMNNYFSPLDITITSKFVELISK